MATTAVTEAAVVSHALAALSDEGAGAGDQAAALAVLCDALAMAGDDFFEIFPIDGLAPRLSALVASGGDGEGGGEEDVNLPLLATRAIAEACEGAPHWADFFVGNGAVEALRDRILAIEYMDLAEECLRALDIISLECPHECLRRGVVAAVLQFFDFFSTSKQKVALKIVTNACDGYDAEDAPKAMDAAPALCSLLQCTDKTIQDSAVSCLAMVAVGARGHADHMDRLCECNVVEASMQLMKNNGWKNFSEETLTGLIGLLGDLAAVSVKAVKSLLELDVLDLLKKMITFYSSSHVNNNMVCMLVQLIYQLMPPLATSDHHSEVVIAKKNGLVEQINFNQLVVGTVPLVIQIAKSSVLSTTCFICALIISNVVELSTPELLLELEKTVNISSFLACLLARKNRHIIFQTLKASKILLRKHHQFFSESFKREGVKHAIDAISSREKDSNSSKNNMQRRCLCFVFNLGTSSTDETCRVENNYILLAEEMKNSYFGMKSNKSSDRFVKSLRELLVLVGIRDLRVLKCIGDFFARPDSDDRTPPAQDLEIRNQLSDTSRRLASDELPNTSTFEFMESESIKYLAGYLSNDAYLQNFKGDHHLLGQVKEVQDRLQKFAHLALALPGKSSAKPLEILIEKLLDALHMWCYDSFPAILSDEQCTREAVVIPRRHSESEKPQLLNIKFVRSRRENELQDYDGVIPVDISSTPDSIEAVLLPEICKRTGSEPATKKSSQQKEATPTETNQSGKSTELKNGDERKSSSLIFSYKGKKLRPSVTFFESIIHLIYLGEPNLIFSSSFWDEEHKITYRRKNTKESSSQSACDTQLSHTCGKLEQSWLKDPFFSSILLGKLPGDLDKSDPSYDLLFMLKALEGINRFSYQLLMQEQICEFAKGSLRELDDVRVTISPVSQQKFMSNVLTNKLELQMQEGLFQHGLVPSWCAYLMETCPFLMSVETRWKYFCLTAHHSFINGQAGPSRTRKFRVIRNAILEAAASMMTQLGSCTDITEVEFNGEVGTGRGPTFEFYTTVSHELQRVGLGIWRGDNKTGRVEGETEFVNAPFGLFPRPWSSEASSSQWIDFPDVVKKFKLLGHLVARAVLDGRVLDIPLSKAFYKVMLDQELDIYDIPSFDPELGKAMIEFQALVSRKKFLETSLGGISNTTADLSYKNVRLEDLCLDFTLPGNPEYDLVSGGSEKMVTLDNLEEYVSLVVDATVKSGIARQIEAFKSGINEIFALKTLKVFTEEDMERILCGDRDDWTSINLEDHIKFEHGYDVNSPSVVSFLEILREFGREEQRAFAQFTTGAPQLPLGGLASLDPKLTVVRKQCDGKVDNELPSVNTCRHYIKLPPYSSKEIMRQKLKYALTEGLGSFHLS